MRTISKPGPPQHLIQQACIKEAKVEYSVITSLHKTGIMDKKTVLAGYFLLVALVEVISVEGQWPFGEPYDQGTL